eukprot:9137669-Karenia_brevis.AAC.1
MERTFGMTAGVGVGIQQRLLGNGFFGLLGGMMQGCLRALQWQWGAGRRLAHRGSWWQRNKR